jgi:hypothetical protein
MPRYELVCQHPQPADRCGVETIEGNTFEFVADNDDVARQRVDRHVQESRFETGKKIHYCHPRLLNRIDGKQVARVDIM